MAFKGFRTGIIWRVALIGLVMFGICLLFLSEKYISLLVAGAVLAFQFYNLFYFVENTNRKLTRFLESVRYSDFVSGFTYDNKLGRSFKGLNEAFNEVLEAFRRTRSQNEENLLYLHTVVQHVTVGLIAVNLKGEVELINPVAKRLVGYPQMRNVHDLESLHPPLHRALSEMKAGQNTLIRLNANVELAISTTELRLQGKSLQLFSLQNIRSELQKNEIQAWQNLTRVLRHEIMNSITPIASLVSTLNEIITEDLYEDDEGLKVSEEALEDIREGLRTIGNRSKGLIRFVNAYRDFTNIPAPHFAMLEVAILLENICKLMQGEVKKSGIYLHCQVEPPALMVFGDYELLEMVLINLVKNALQAVNGRDNAKIELLGGIDSQQRPIIQVRDNGPGIIPDALDRIFIPFYTTKKEGSGIGLSLSRQIMQLHNGNLSVESIPEQQTVFTLQFS